MLACFTWWSWGFILIGMWGSDEGSSAIYNALDAHRCCNSWPTKGDRLREIDAFVSRDSLYTMMVRLRTDWNIVSKKNSNLFNGVSRQERFSSWINLNLLPFFYSVVAVLRKLQNCATASICNLDWRLATTDFNSQGSVALDRLSRTSSELKCFVSSCSVG